MIAVGGIATQSITPNYRPEKNESGSLWRKGIYKIYISLGRLSYCSVRFDLSIRNAVL